MADIAVHDSQRGIAGKCACQVHFDLSCICVVTRQRVRRAAEVFFVVRHSALQSREQRPYDGSMFRRHPSSNHSLERPTCSSVFVNARRRRDCRRGCRHLWCRGAVHGFRRLVVFSTVSRSHDHSADSPHRSGSVSARSSFPVRDDRRARITRPRDAGDRRFPPPSVVCIDRLAPPSTCARVESNLRNVKPVRVSHIFQIVKARNEVHDKFLLVTRRNHPRATSPTSPTNARRRVNPHKL
mmetsp:Transcript_10991/g.27859  ORF Transcript_10991/g.27859 Transcript_10991/m.27859 type:complete len:240 (+) Transcript_10991:789-1508(+)